MESQERILQSDHFCSHWLIKLPMKFFAPNMRYWQKSPSSSKSQIFLPIFPDLFRINKEQHALTISANPNLIIG